MNFSSLLIWGFAATIVMTTTMAAGQGLGYTRMSIPFLLGTIFTPARDRAMVVGVLVHMMNGLIFAIFYAAVFESIGLASWWLGGAVGAIHGLFVLTVGMAMLPGLHPHMVSEYFGPTPNRLLQPPGFLALNYGRRTPLVTMLAHVLFGVILGWFYRLS
jgi:hypothetical protein